MVTEHKMQAARTKTACETMWSNFAKYVCTLGVGSLQNTTSVQFSVWFCKKMLQQKLTAVSVFRCLVSVYSTLSFTRKIK